MRYSPRQSHCLRHMGLTPWVDRHVIPDRVPADPAVAQAAASAASAATSAEPLAVSTVAAPAVSPAASPSELQAAPLPATADALGAWFRAQPLLAVSGPVIHGGQAGVSLVFPGNAADAHDALPEQGASARLLNDMLKAIGLRRRDVSLWRCCRGDDEARGGSVRSDGATLLNSPGVCLLVCAVPVEDESAAAHRLDSSAALYLLPHPAALQQAPARKRAAWNVLKQVRAHLDADPAPGAGGG